MPEPNCHYCDRPAEAQCATCGRLYCGDHGDDVCLRCMAPESATPSAAVYRGSLLALVLGTAVVVFLLVRPPESKSAADVARPLATSTTSIGATATATRPGGTPTVARTNTPVPGSPTVPGSATTAPGSPTTSASATAATAKAYTVVPGDTLSGIAAKNGITLAQLLAANPGLTETSVITIGQVLNLP
jgi:LysM repeat protein